MMYDNLRTQLEQVGRLPVPEPRPEFTDGLLARLQAVEQISSLTAPAAPVAMRGAHRLRILTAGAVAAAFLGVIGYVSMQGADEVPITMTASFGTVEVTRDDGTILLNPSGETRLQPGDTVFVSEGSQVKIGDDVILGGEAGVALVVNENGDVSAPPVSAEATVADDPTTSSEATVVESSTTETAEATDTFEAAKEAAVQAEAATQQADAATTTGSSSALPSTTAEATTPTTAVPVPTEPIIVQPTENPTTVPTTIPVDDGRPAALKLEKLKKNGEQFTLKWQPYVGEDFGCYVILYTTGNDLSTTDSTSFPLGGSSTQVLGSPIFDQGQRQSELSAPFGQDGEPMTSGVALYRIVATDGPCTSPTGDPKDIDYGNLVAISEEALGSLQDPGSRAVEHSTRAEFQRVGDGGGSAGS